MVQILNLFIQNFRTGQIGPADVADEEQVSGKQHFRLFGTGHVGHQQGDGIGGVPGRMQDFNFGGAEFENVPLLEILVFVFDRSAFVNIDVCALSPAAIPDPR
jgi:hypothetical protein